MKEASISQRLAADVKLADEEYKVAEAGNAALIAALDKGGKDYNNQLKGLQDKALELTQEHAVTLAGLNTKATVAQYRLDLENMEQGERDKIEATVQGSAARLAAIDAAIKEEASKNLQDTANYRELLKQRVQAERQYAEESGKLTAEAGKEQSANTLKMGELALAAAKQNQALIDSGRRVSIQQRIAEETKAANDGYAVKLTAMQQEAAALDKGSNDYLNKLKEIQDKELQLTREHENQLTQIKDQAEMERNQTILAAEQHFTDSIASGLTQVLMGHKSFASMMTSIGDQVVSGLTKNVIQQVLMGKILQQSKASEAAASAYAYGESIPVVGIVAGPAFAAAAYAGVMAFQDGTDMVPGIGKGDKVPAMLEPGEGVVPGGVMDNLRKMSSSGEMGGDKHFHVTAHFAPTIHAIDATGVGKMLTEHADEFHQHFQRTLRKMNK